VPLDPGRHWLEAGITGLARPREWDAVATVELPGDPGDEAVFVALSDGRLLIEACPSGFDADPLAAALAGAIEPPYRAVAVRRPELWAVGACAIQVVQLVEDPGGDSVEIVRSADGVATRIGGVPSLATLPQLEGMGSGRFATYVVRARRLVGPLFEVEVEPL
jgi:hypothetical protein